MKRLKSYPSQICWDCGVTYGKIPTRAHARWSGYCDVCGKKCKGFRDPGVTSPRDHGYPQFPGFETYNTGWPNALNPCCSQKPHFKKAHFNVQGRTTEICCDCLWEYEKSSGNTGDRQKILDAHFVPDPKGMLCKKE
jgi:hypothetical protein